VVLLLAGAVRAWRRVEVWRQRRRILTGQGVDLPAMSHP
jgi:hypothetical protein